MPPPVKPSRGMDGGDPPASCQPLADRRTAVCEAAAAARETRRRDSRVRACASRRLVASHIAHRLADLLFVARCAPFYRSGL